MAMRGLAFCLVLVLACCLVYRVHGIRDIEIHNPRMNSRSRHCDIFQGSWVYDPLSNPLYDTSVCPFIEREFDCLQNGRQDRVFLNFRWQPRRCNLPRFNAEDFLQRLRGKNLLFVGDSLGLNQWQSLTCMLHATVPEAKYTLVRIGGLSIFTFPEYDAKLKFSRNAFLVDTVKEEVGPVLKLDSIEGGEDWKDNDILIFDSWHWWIHRGSRQPWKFIQEGNQTTKDMDRLIAYEKALTTWANWINENVNPQKTKVFFQGVSPDHANSSQWDDPSAKNCQEQMVPVLGSKYPSGAHPAEKVLERVLKEKVRKEVQLLNISTLSQLRKDGHPSVYGSSDHKGMDCSHWCLPGVPDVWNHLLYAALFHG